VRDTAEAIADGARGLDAIIAHNGYACFNWHQRTFAMKTALQSEPDNWVTILEGLLDHYQTHAAKWWNPLPGELARFWSHRAEVHIESTPECILVRNLDHEDCNALPNADFVLALHTDAQIAGGEPVPQCGVVCLPAGVEAGEQRRIDLPLVTLSEQGEEMLKEALKEVRAGKVTKHESVEAALEHLYQGVTGCSLAPSGFGEVVAHLALSYVVLKAKPLLL